MDSFQPGSGHIARIRQALLDAQRQAESGQKAPNGRHVEDALAEAEESIGNIVALIDRALDRDMAEAEESGEAERERRAWHPSYRAA